MKRKRKREEVEVGGRGAAALTEKRTHQFPQMTAVMELLHPAPFLLFLLFLLTRPGVTSADNNGPVKVEVKEGDDVVLPCSHGQTDLKYMVFDWTKVEDDEDKTQQEVFLYDAGIHYNNGRAGQDPQFKGRVSHFEDELQHGNASIEIRNTKLEDRGKYKCIFPNLGNQIFHIELDVGPVKVKVKEGDDVVLPCSHGQTDLTYKLFDWKKDDQQEVFLYDSGIHYNNGRGGQDPQFKGRVSHFEDELHRGNASIKIRNTKLEDRGKYKCIFPRLRNQIFHIELVVGAVPKPSVATVEQTADRALLQCSVKGAFPEPTVEWKNSAGKVLPSVVTHDSEVNDRFDITLQTNVTQTGYYSCVVTQDDIGHQVYSEIFEWFGPVEVKVTEGYDVVLPCSHGQTNLKYQIFDWKKDDQQEVFLYDAGIHYNNGRTGQDPQFKGRVSHFEDELQHGNASIKIRNTKLEDSGKYKCMFPRLQDQTFHIELVVGASPKPVVTILDESNDWSLLQCVVRGASPKPTVEWRDSSGNVVPAKEPQVTERGGSYDIILQTTVTKTDRYRCVSTQEEIKHQVHAEIHVYISGSQFPWWGWIILVIGVVIGGVIGGVIGRGIGGVIGGGILGFIGGAIVVAALWILAFLRKHFCGGSARSNADSKGDDEDAPLPTNGSSDNRAVVKEGSDAVHLNIL